MNFCSKYVTVNNGTTEDGLCLFNNIRCLGGPALLNEVDCGVCVAQKACCGKSWRCDQFYNTSDTLFDKLTLVC